MFGPAGYPLRLSDLRDALVHEHRDRPSGRRQRGTLARRRTRRADVRRRRRRDRSAARPGESDPRPRDHGRRQRHGLLRWRGAASHVSSTPSRRDRSSSGSRSASASREKSIGPRGTSSTVTRRCRSSRRANDSDDESSGRRRLAQFADFGVAKTLGIVVVHESGGLHQRVTRRGTDESKAALLQLLAHAFGLGGRGREVWVPASNRAASVCHRRRTTGIRSRLEPLRCSSSDRAGVVDRRLDLAAVANDVDVLHSRSTSSGVNAATDFGLNRLERLHVAGATLENRQPTQSRPGLLRG